MIGLPTALISPLLTFDWTAISRLLKSCFKKSLTAFNVTFTSPCPTALLKCFNKLKPWSMISTTSRTWWLGQCSRLDERQGKTVRCCWWWTIWGKKIVRIFLLRNVFKINDLKTFVKLSHSWCIGRNQCTWSFFLLLGGTSSILRTFWAEPVKKKKPCTMDQQRKLMNHHHQPVQRWQIQTPCAAGSAGPST